MNMISVREIGTKYVVIYLNLGYKGNFWVILLFKIKLTKLTFINSRATSFAVKMPTSGKKTTGNNAVT